MKFLPAEREKETLTQQAQQTLQHYKMLRPGDHVVVGLSGGADSVALLHWLCSVRGEFQLRFTAVHVNHGLRGEESEQDEAFCRQLCEQWQLPLQVKRVAFASFTEEAGRNARYAFFESIGGSRIALAHTLSDRAETFLLNVARGTALRGLCSIPPVRGQIIRPLIDCTREQVEDYCAAHGLGYRTDSTNTDTSYRRNYIRSEVLPLLHWQPEHLRRMFAALEADEAYLSEQAGRLEDVLAAPEPLKNRALRMMLATAGREPTQARMHELEKQISSPKFTKKLRVIHKHGLANAEGYDTIECDVLKSLRTEDAE